MLAFTLAAIVPEVVIWKYYAPDLPMGWKMAYAVTTLWVALSLWVMHTRPFGLFLHARLCHLAEVDLHRAGSSYGMENRIGLLLSGHCRFRLWVDLGMEKTESQGGEHPVA